MHPKVQAIWENSKSLVKDNERVAEVIKQASKKIHSFSDDDEKKGKLVEKLKLVIRMITAHVSGRYNAFSSKSIFFMVFAILYFVIPTDLIPDLIPVLGFTDDLTVLYFVTESISDDIDSFETWEIENQSIIET